MFNDFLKITLLQLFILDHLPDALRTGCAKCSEKQRAGSEKVIVHLIKNKPQDYAVLEKIYDPQGTYKKKYEAEAKKLGI